MKTLWSSSSRVCSNNFRGKERDNVMFNSLREILGTNENRFLSYYPKQIGINFFNPIFSMQKYKRRIQHVYASSVTQETLQDEPTQVQDTSKTVHVKFHLQRKCSFGEQFFLLGDDTMFGSWDPLNAIPLDWSEGDIWTAELDVPIEKVIEYKFILRKITGDVLWQPGPDRLFQTWETTKMISVFEDWENAELQIILEEEFVPKNKEELKVGLDKKIIAENINDSVKEPAINQNNKATNEKNSIRANDEQVLDHVLNDEVSYKGVPVLVPGLTPVSTMDTEDTTSSESDYHIDDNPLSQAEKLKEHSGPELEVESPHSEDSTKMITHIQAEQDDRQEISYKSTVEKGQAYLKQIETVFKKDTQWGRTILQKLFNIFGF